MHHSRRAAQQGAIGNFLVLLLAFGAVVFTFMVGITYMLRDTENDGDTAAPSLVGVHVTALVAAEHGPAAETLATWFSQETGAQVETVEADLADLAQTLRADASAESPRLDVAVVWYPDLGGLAAEGLLAELTDLAEMHAEDIEPADFFPGLYAAFTMHQGGRFALPFDGGMQCLYYRPSLLAKHGFDAPPATWEQYLETARAVTKGESPTAYGAAIAAMPDSLDAVASFVNRLAALGGQLITTDGRPALDSPQALAALALMVEQAAQALPVPVETDRAKALAAFLDGRVAMAEHGSEMETALRDPARSLIGEDWAVAPLPGGQEENATRLMALDQGFALAVPASAPHPEAAMAFVLYASRPEVSRRLCALEQGIDPVRVSALESAGFAAARPKLAEAVREGAGVAMVWPSGPDAHAMLEVLADNVAAALTGTKTPEQALKDAQQAWLDIPAN